LFYPSGKVAAIVSIMLREIYKSDAEERVENGVKRQGKRAAQISSAKNRKNPIR
jgi:hypothetical protein